MPPRESRPGGPAERFPHALEVVIQRLEERPDHYLRGIRWDYEEGLNIGQINDLAAEAIPGGLVFESVPPTAAAGGPSRLLAVYHPNPSEQGSPVRIQVVDDGLPVIPPLAQVQRAIRYLRAWQEIGTTALKPPPLSQEWVPASEAVKRAERSGHTITPAWLSRLPKSAQDLVQTRPRELPGKHKREVEWNSLAGYLLRRDAKPQGPEEDEGEDDPKEIARRIEHERKKKRQERPLD
jgi:hypothetical protein